MLSCISRHALGESHVEAPPKIQHLYLFSGQGCAFQFTTERGGDIHFDDALDRFTFEENHFAGKSNLSFEFRCSGKTDRYYCANEWTNDLLKRNDANHRLIPIDFIKAGYPAQNAILYVPAHSFGAPPGSGAISFCMNYGFSITEGIAHFDRLDFEEPIRAIKILKTMRLN